jgi:protein O-GlcNAc transferase
MARAPYPQSAPPSGQAIQQALALHREGRFAQAEQLYASVLTQQADHFEACYLLAMLKMQQGQPLRALPHIEAAAKINPDSAEALTMLGGVLAMLERPVDALAAYDRLLRLRPGDADALYNRGVVLAKVGRHEEALKSYEKTLALRHDHMLSLFNRASTLAALGQWEQARAAYDALLAIAPHHVEALIDRGNVLAQLGQQAESIASYDRALALKPSHLIALSNRGNVLRDEGRHEEALAMYDQALAIDPRHIASLTNRGNVLIELERSQEALETIDRALALAPRDADLLFNRACSLKDLGRFDAALAGYDECLSIRSDNADALHNRGNLLAFLDRHEQALASYQAALAIEPGRADSRHNRGNVLIKLERYDEAIADFQQVRACDPLHPSALDSLAFAQLSVCNWGEVSKLASAAESALNAGELSAGTLFPLYHFGNPEYQLKSARAGLRRELRSTRPPLPHRTSQRPHRLRIAYLSSDFRVHPVGIAIAELLERHDRGRFEIIGVSIGPDDGSAMRSRIVRACDQFHDFAFDRERTAAEKLNRLGVHVAIDLNGLTRGARPGVLACRPAPIQASYLGYPATMGADFIDYVIADATVLPLDQHLFFNEKIVHLPHCFHPSDTTRRTVTAVPSRSDLGLPDSVPVFCAFTQSFKITAAMFTTWMRLLARVAGSVLWLSRMNEAARANLRAAAAERGIDPVRLVFAPRLESIEDHLARHRQATLFLDTLPYNAHSTAIDALWAGLPVVTCTGSAFAGRVGASLLKAVGLPELVTRTLEDYEALAARLAGDASLLQAIRGRLEENRASPLFDMGRLCCHIEAAYRTMWDIHARGEKPRHFKVEALQ